MPRCAARVVCYEWCANAPFHASGELPILRPNALRLGEFVATLALAQDNAFGQPLESQLRSCLLATWLCEAAGYDRRGPDPGDLRGVRPAIRCTRPPPPRAAPRGGGDA